VFTAYTNCKQFNLFIVIFYCKSTKHERELSILAGLLTDHITLNRHLIIMKTQEDPLLAACGEKGGDLIPLLGEMLRYYGK